MTKVLIIEDDPMVAMLNQQFIEKIGKMTVVDNVRNIIEARQVLSTEDIDLLLLDVFLPGTTGIEFLAELHEKKIKIAVILITAANDVATVQDAVYYGVVDYLIKPFTFERFQRSIEKYLELTHITEDTQAASQIQLDRYFNHTKEEKKKTPSPETIKVIPKGLSGFTLNKVFNKIIEQVGSFSTEELSTKVGLSRISTKKYIQFLLSIHVLDEELEYLEVGRPLTLYRLNKSKQNDVLPYLN